MKTEKLLAKLKEGTSVKKQETLDAIYTICSEQVERGLTDFSIATIAKLGFKRGVPKAQSLRNKAGEKYRRLISSFEQKSPFKGLTKLSKSDEDWIDGISNPKHRLLARIQASELKGMQQRLKKIIPPDTVIEVIDHRVSTINAEHRLTKQERKALEYLLSKSFKDKWSFSQTELGELVDENGKSVFKVATVDAIKKALNYL